MINKQQYLYWLNPNDPRLVEEIISREMYSRIGYIFHLVQMAEYNLANILSIEEFEKETKKVFSMDDVERIKKVIEERFESFRGYTFGQFKNEVSKSAYLSDIDLNKLANLVQYRNYLAHCCFKEKLIRKELETADDIDRFVTELNKYEAEIISLNEYLVKVFKEEKTKTILMISE